MYLSLQNNTFINYLTRLFNYNKINYIAIILMCNIANILFSYHIYLMMSAVQETALNAIQAILNILNKV